MSLTVQELVEKQVRRARARRLVGGDRLVRPCIAFARLPGTSAEALAHDVAKRLGFEFFGNEIVDAMAQEQGLERGLVEALDEHVRSAIERYVVDAFRVGTFLEADYQRSLLRILRSIGENGSAVILGRGAPWILPPERSLRILVVESLDARTERLARERRLASDAAAEELRREEENRREFYRYHFHVDPDDVSLYDAALNTGRIALDAASEMAVLAYHARFGSAS